MRRKRRSELKMRRR